MEVTVQEVGQWTRLFLQLPCLSDPIFHRLLIALFYELEGTGSKYSFTAIF